MGIFVIDMCKSFVYLTSVRRRLSRIKLGFLAKGASNVLHGTRNFKAAGSFGWGGHLVDLTDVGRATGAGQSAKQKLCDEDQYSHRQRCGASICQEFRRGGRTGFR